LLVGVAIVAVELGAPGSGGVMVVAWQKAKAADAPTACASAIGSRGRPRPPQLCIPLQSIRQRYYTIHPIQASLIPSVSNLACFESPQLPGYETINDARVATEWQDQMAASMSMGLPIEGTAVDWCALLFASFTFVELQKKISPTWFFPHIFYFSKLT
jgi:hypothetical protein